MNANGSGKSIKPVLLGFLFALAVAGMSVERVEAVGEKPLTKTGKPAADQSCKQFCATITIRKPDGSMCSNIVPVEKSGFCECQCQDNTNSSGKKGGKLGAERK
jgi:hypothetical protein